MSGHRKFNAYDIILGTILCQTERLERHIYAGLFKYTAEANAERKNIQSSFEFRHF